MEWQPIIEMFDTWPEALTNGAAAIGIVGFVAAVALAPLKLLPLFRKNPAETNKASVTTIEANPQNAITFTPSITVRSSSDDGTTIHHVVRLSEAKTNLERDKIDLLKEKGELQKKLSDLEEQMEAAKKASKAYANLGAIASLNDTDKAITAYTNAIKFNPHNTDAWWQLGHLQKQKGLVLLESSKKSHKRARFLDHSVNESGVFSRRQSFSMKIVMSFLSEKVLNRLRWALWKQ